MASEQRRLQEAAEPGTPWKKWGPYLSERQWGTVREDYSETGDAWNYFPHDHARSRAYRWGEDGLAGISDDRQRLCFALALWNGADPIIKERLFGLTNTEGNHGEDVKEYYFYLDSTPDPLLHEVPLQVPAARRIPYDDLVADQRASRGATSPSTSCSTPGSSTTDRYFDVFVEYAKAAPEDILIRITADQPRPRAGASCTCSRPSGSATPGPGAGRTRPSRRSGRRRTRGVSAVVASRTPSWAPRCACTARVTPTLLFTENETNAERLFGSAQRRRPTSRTRINDYVVHGRREAVNPAAAGTKVGGPLRARPSSRARPRSCACGCRLGRAAIAGALRRLRRDVFATRAGGGRRLLRRHHPGPVDRGRGAGACGRPFAGMLWTKQYYHFDVEQWLRGEPARPAAAARRLDDAQRASGPHGQRATSSPCPTSGSTPGTRPGTSPSTRVALALVDPVFAKEQLLLMLARMYHAPERPDPRLRVELRRRQPARPRLGRLVHLHGSSSARGARATSRFLEQRLPASSLINFTWWVNRKDRDGQQRLRGRLPRARQHRRLRPQRAAAHRRVASSRPTARPGWRFYCQNMLPDRARAGARKTPPTRTWPPSSSSTSSGSPRAMNSVGERTTTCGTSRTASSTTSSGSRTAGPTDSRCAPWSAWSRCARPPSSAGSSGRVRIAFPEFERAARRASCERHPRPGAEHRAARPPACGNRRLLAAAQRGQAAPRAGAHARRERVPRPLRHPRPLALPPRAPVRRVRRRNESIDVRLRAGRVRRAGCSAATPTGGARSGFR